MTRIRLQINISLCLSTPSTCSSISMLIMTIIPSWSTKHHGMGIMTVNGQVQRSDHSRMKVAISAVLLAMTGFFFFFNYYYYSLNCFDVSPGWSTKHHSVKYDDSKWFCQVQRGDHARIKWWPVWYFRLYCKISRYYIFALYFGWNPVSSTDVNPNCIKK